MVRDQFENERLRPATSIDKSNGYLTIRGAIHLLPHSGAKAMP